MKYLISIKLALLFCVFMTSSSMAHSGRTNAEGCHTNHRTGDYHCHRSKSVQQEDSSGEDQAIQSPNKATSSQNKSTAHPRKKKTAAKKRTPPLSESDTPQTNNSLETPLAPPPDQHRLCLDSHNINAYWEAVSERCLDRKTGRTVDL